MIKEYHCVVLLEDLPAESLQAGDVGTVTHIHQGGEGYEVEFATPTGQTVGVATLSTSQVRAVSARLKTKARAPRCEARVPCSKLTALTLPSNRRDQVQSRHRRHLQRQQVPVD